MILFKLGFSQPLIAAFIVSSVLIWSGLTYAASIGLHLHLDPERNVAKYVACLAAEQVTLVSVHRGGPKPGFPENALETMQEAVKHGPMLLEIDIRETADGHLVLLHDSSLERTTTGKGNLADYTLEELDKLRLLDNDGKETPFTIPTLKEVLKWADDRAIVQLDVKRGIDYAKVARAVIEADAVDSTLIIAYRLEDAVTSLGIDERLSFSFSVNQKDDLTALDNAGVPREHIVAWTGVVEQNDKSIWPVLESLDIPSAAGAFWNLEHQILRSGNTQPYIDLSKAGIDVIGSDHYWMAYDTLATQQDIASALTTCKGQ